MVFFQFICFRVASRSSSDVLFARLMIFPLTKKEFGVEIVNEPRCEIGSPASLPTATQ